MKAFVKVLKKLSAFQVFSKSRQPSYSFIFILLLLFT